MGYHLVKKWKKADKSFNEQIYKKLKNVDFGPKKDQFTPF